MVNYINHILYEVHFWKKIKKIYDHMYRCLGKDSVLETLVILQEENVPL